MKRIHWSVSLLTLLIGFILGTSTLGSAKAADPVGVTTTAQGDLLKVCIEKKSGVLRAGNKCKPTENSFVIGGPGPQGEQGEKGEPGSSGPQGERGPIGLTGAAGSISGIKTETIYYLSANDICQSTNGSVTYVSQVSRSPQTNAVTGVYSGSFRGCYATIYKP